MARHPEVGEKEDKQDASIKLTVDSKFSSLPRLPPPSEASGRGLVQELLDAVSPQWLR